MRALSALLGALCALLWSVSVQAQEPARLAVISYLTLNLEPEEEQSLREILTSEIRRRTSAKLLTSVELKKLGALPDGCTENPECIQTSGQTLRADYLLFIVLLKEEQSIELTLTLAEVGGGGSIRRQKATLPGEDPERWDEAIQRAVNDLLSGVKRLALPEALVPPVSQPSSQPVVIEAPRKRWPLLVLGGVVLAAGGAAAFLFIPAPSTFGRFGPGAN